MTICMKVEFKVVWRIFMNREIRLGFRNPWTYFFAGIFSVFFLLVVAIGSNQVWQGYTFATATVINLMLVLLPLMALLLGSFSLVTEREEGSWKLWMAYPITTLQFVLGKFLGLLLVMLTIVGFSVGFAIVVGGLFGSFLSILSMVTFLSTAIGLVLTFTLLGIVIGSIVRTRWQALAVSVGLWFVLVIAWPTLWFAVLSAVPYSLIQPLLLGGFAFNPAEWMRIVAILAFGSGSILGPDYHKLVINAANPLTWLGASVYILLWIGIHFITACMIWEKRRYNG